MNNLSLMQSDDRARVLTQAVIITAQKLRVNSVELGEILGFSQPTSSRLLNQKYQLKEGSKEWEISAYFIRLYRSLFSIVGDEETAIKWMTSRNEAFNQEAPINYIKRIDGLIYACEYLDAHRATV